MAYPRDLGQEKSEKGGGTPDNGICRGDGHFLGRFIHLLNINWVLRGSKLVLVFREQRACGKQPFSVLRSVYFSDSFCPV